MDRLLHSLMWFTVMGLIMVCAGAAILVGYTGLLQLVSGAGAPATGSLLLSILLSGATWLMCRHCNDLIDR